MVKLTQNTMTVLLSEHGEVHRGRKRSAYIGTQTPTLQSNKETKLCRPDISTLMNCQLELTNHSVR